MPMKKRRVTSADIARAAGVSQATVSYVVNDVPGQSISPTTRARILEAATSLGYTPYGPAKTLATGRSNLVLMVLPGWPIGYAFSAALDEVETRLAAVGLSLLMHRIIRPSQRNAESWKAIGPFAVIGLDDFDDAEARAMRDAGIEVVTAELDETEGQTRVSRPQLIVGRLQVGHLARTGHERLGYAFPDDDRLIEYSTPRLEGVRLACAELGLGEPIVQVVPQYPEPAAEAVREWKRLGVTAICAYNDEVALAVLAGLYALGLEAPADLAVVGADNDPTGRLSCPSLTTVDLHHRDLGRRLAELVIGAYLGQPVPKSEGPIPSELVIRHSAP